MKHANALVSESEFEVLQTTARSQTAVMILEEGEASSQAPNRHPKSDQVLVVLEGKVTGEIGGELCELGVGDSVIVEANTPHRFVNPAKARAVTFSVYTPPAYPE